VVNWVFAVSYLLTLLALMGVFVYIPVVSQCAFWVVIASYLLLASHRQYIIWIAFR
jgi:Sec-independent protein secretion pathway component TatC